MILRVAHNCRCDYEWRHHERLGRAAGLSEADIGRVLDGPAASGWTPRQSLLLRAADELHDHRELIRRAVGALSGELSDVELIELVMLIGHYEMLAMTIGQPSGPARRARALRAGRRCRASRAGGS